MKQYLAHFWGEFLQKNGLHSQYVWFNTEEECDDYIAYMTGKADHANMGLVYDKVSNAHIELRTIAKMTFKYDGTLYPFEYDFGFGYPIDSAEYMFKDGNYSCDCNRADFLELSEMDCGNKIELIKFEVVLR
jgi:hypothetical protein